MENVVTLVAAVIGSGGISAVITSILSARKYKAEARVIEAEAEERTKKSEREYMDYIHSQLKEITETHKKESEELRAMNKELNDKVSALKNELDILISWIITDNNAYRTWLENELHKRDPELKFPMCKEPPILTHGLTEVKSDT